MALFALFVVALLSPLNNLFQPLEKTTPYTDTEYQVAATAVAASLCVIVALVRKGSLCRNVTGCSVVRFVFPTVRVGHPPVRSTWADKSPPPLIPLRI